ncbi:MAG: hypothetical protein ACTID5_19585 [Pseudomonas helleri]|uniref:hypothetical protein n=1 Tax=Pseudomonas helleri TaxID=1608996 RepID=UPI003FB8B1AB
MEAVAFSGADDFTFFYRRLPDAFGRGEGCSGVTVHQRRPHLAAITTADVLLVAPIFRIALLM